ncbi:hypothetical protein H8356DRAFT_1436439 [Neocallimastix lanati (nom. inval.)]|nr:hypothetical protein H8356DRAFT_1436439 [Neocallimastix sp. JGI-2020a]
MKFYNALLLLAATLSLTLANNLEVSDLEENDVAGTSLDAGFGESSEPEIDQNEAPIEPPTIVPPSFPNTPSTPPSTPPSSGPSVPPPSTGPSVPPPSSGPSVPPPSTGPSVPPPSSGPSVPPSSPVTDNTSADSVPESPVSDNTSADGINANGVTADSGEASDDYGNESSINNIDNTQAPADSADVSGDSANADNGEGSDDYGEADNSGVTDNAGVNSNDVTNADAEGENSADEEESSTGTKAALGIAGAAALSSAGIFLWVKRSKRNEGYVQSVQRCSSRLFPSHQFYLFNSLIVYEKSFEHISDGNININFFYILCLYGLYVSFLAEMHCINNIFQSPFESIFSSRFHILWDFDFYTMINLYTIRPTVCQEYQSIYRLFLFSKLIK